MDGFIACFEGLEDPRTGNDGRHDLLEILMIALCTVLCGGQSAVDMAEFAEDKEAFLRGFLTLEHGPPSHDTFSRVLRLLDPDQFRACFQRFMARFAEAAQGVVAIDGKVLRRSFDAASGKSALHMVTAWGCDQRLGLAQIATDAKSNEITALPRLLEMLSLKGTIVTVDALNCQRDIARRIVERGGDYVLALKGNQGTLHSDVRLFLDDPETRPTDVHTTVDGDHGRIETRTCTVSTDTDGCSRFTTGPASPGFRQVSRQILSGGTDQPWRAVSSSGDGQHIAEGGDSLDMDRPSTSRGHVLLAPGDRSEEVAHFVMGPAEAGGAGVGLKASHRLVAPFCRSVILLQMVV
jgi:predicted transposase YbfD/YdcC